MALDLSRDHLAQDDLETGTLRVRAAGLTQDGYTDYAVPRVSRKAISRDEMAKRGVFGESLEVWWTWREALDAATPSAAPAPKKNDYFVDDDGVEWCIEEVKPQRRRNAYRCLCRQQT